MIVQLHPPYTPLHPSHLQEDTVTLLSPWREGGPAAAGAGPLQCVPESPASYSCSSSSSLPSSSHRQIYCSSCTSCTSCPLSSYTYYTLHSCFCSPHYLVSAPCRPLVPAPCPFPAPKPCSPLFLFHPLLLLLNHAVPLLLSHAFPLILHHTLLLLLLTPFSCS